MDQDVEARGRGIEGLRVEGVAALVVVDVEVANGFVSCIHGPSRGVRIRGNSGRMV